VVRGHQADQDREGWLYLAAVQDLFSRRIVGWAMQPHMRSELVVAALEMAVARRRPPKARSITQTTAASTSA
jgi:transposase InsO family protein